MSLAPQRAPNIASVPSLVSTFDVLGEVQYLANGGLARMAAGLLRDEVSINSMTSSVEYQACHSEKRIDICYLGTDKFSLILTLI